MPFGDLLADERLEVGAVQRGQRPLTAGGEAAERGQIARVALEGVRGEPPLDAEVIQVGVEHGDYATIRDLSEVRESPEVA
jgi:hypothetical protein